MTTPNLPKLTASNFRDPLLRVLGTLTGFKAGKSVDMSTTYPHVMTLMDISDEMAYGVNEASGSPMVIKWIQWAFTGLVDAKPSLGERKGRGLWALTEAGVDAARQLGGVTIAPLDPVTTQASATLTTPSPSPVPAPVVVGGVSLLVGTGFPTDTYDPDPYIRSLVIEQTGCFGAFTDNPSAICTKCPISGACRNAQFALMSRLARTLASEDKAASAPAPAPAPAPASGKGKKGKDSGSSKAGKVNWRKAEEVVAHVESECTICGNKVAKGESAYWIENDTDGGFLVHLSHKGEED